MALTVAVDFGSTYTKAVAFDLASQELAGVSQAKSTVDTDITIGLNAALEKLRGAYNDPLGKEQDVERIVACSSAAGGLRIVAIGLVKVLTTKAAEEAALGAGAKLVGTYSFGLTSADIREIETEKTPDLILLTGGTDGGNKEVMLSNAALLAQSCLDVPMVIAGNRVAAQDAHSVLTAAGKYAVIEENVLPELDRLNVEPTRSRIRDIFMRRITHAKGLDRAKAIVGDIIMPTPMAVLKGASLLARGTNEEEGLGELVVVDIGGATTDVHSVAHGYPKEPAVIVKGLPEPFEKRTVEGDLGIRYNALTILEKAGKEQITKRLAAIDRTLSCAIDLNEKVACLCTNVDVVPENDEDALVDFGLASTAADMAMQRHAGVLTESHFACGRVQILHGKDLTGVKVLIGTGGVFAYGSEPYSILKAALFNPSHPESMRPMSPVLCVDTRYILYAAGLLADIAPTAALRVLKRNLSRTDGGSA
jgi:uncharacterized protein (TIGR01319 family)